MSLLVVNDLCVKVDGKEILTGVDLEIDENETHVLMAPNACGKTTLVRRPVPDRGENLLRGLYPL